LGVQGLKNIIFGQSGIFVAHFQVSKAKITVCLGIVRLNSYGLLKGIYRLLMAAKFAVGNAKINDFLAMDEKFSENQYNQPVVVLFETQIE